MALFNATKKQYGLHTHLLNLSLSRPASPISVPSHLPELPPTPMPDATFSMTTQESADRLYLTEPDIAQFSRFVREFVTMSLVPWMERCVLDWNEAVRQIQKLYKLFSSFLPMYFSILQPDVYLQDCSHQLGDYLEVQVVLITCQHLHNI